MANRKNTGTTGDGGFAAPVSASADAAAQFDMDKALVRFLLEEPFYGHILRHLSKEESDQIPTAGVIADKKNLRFRMLWNRNFMASLKRDQVKGLLIHEVLHLVYEHTTKRSLTPHAVHNWATDLAINSQIAIDLLPPGGLYPGKAFDPLPAAIAAKISPEELQKRTMLSNKIASFPTHQSAEWYFVELMKDPDVANAIEQAGQKRRVKLGDLRVDENGNLTDKDGNPVTVIPGSTDDHDGWGDEGEGDDAGDGPNGDEAAAVMNQKVRDALAEAIRRADASNQWGSVGHDMRAELRALVSNEVPWQQLLKRFVGFARSSKRATSWSRINRKNPGGTTGTKRGVEARIAVYVDQSGSVDSESLALLFGELQVLAKRTEFTIFPFDTSVGTATKVTRRRLPEVYRQKCGGTDFQVACTHGDNLCRTGEIHGYLVLTDGECYKPTPSRFRRGWIVVPNRKLLFEPDPGEIHIQMVGEK